MDSNEECLEGLKQHIHDSSRQSWLFGAGISRDANIPLMYPLTDRVKAIIDADNCDADKGIIGDLWLGTLDASSISIFSSEAKAFTRARINGSLLTNALNTS